MTNQEKKELGDALRSYVTLKNQGFKHLADDTIDELIVRSKNNEKQLLEVSKKPFVGFAVWKQALIWLVFLILNILILT